MVVNSAASRVKTVADPNIAYDSMLALWNKGRAACSGERFVKQFDRHVDNVGFNNLLIPFSPSMTPTQYDFYKSEAEWPGIVVQYSKMIVGGLLRKQPLIELPKTVPVEAKDWIINEFGQDSSPIVHFLDKALWDEVQTTRCWVYIDYPKIKNPKNLTNSDFKEIKPYPVLWTAESVINWKVETDNKGKAKLSRVVVKGYTEDYSKNEFHPDYIETVWVHELVENAYRVRIFKREDPQIVEVISGKIQKNETKAGLQFKLIETIEDIMFHGTRLDFIPAWPLNGSIEPQEPMLSALIDKEVALYNKISRRNHLLYGASTYTPIISSNMSDEDFGKIVNAGLGSWVKLDQGDTASVLETPTEALADMEKAIAAAIEELAKLGIRMLTPESAQSGVALEIRNASQTAQLGTLNTKISNTMSAIIAFMLNWRYNLKLKASDVKFNLSADFNPTPLGADWLRLATEWYEKGLIPRTSWLLLLKENDLLSPEYNDSLATSEIDSDEFINKDIEKASKDYMNMIKDNEN